jgi:hypothetical protein
VTSNYNRVVTILPTATRESCKKCSDRLQGRRDIGKQIASIQVGQYTGRGCKGYSTKEAKAQKRIRRKGELRVGRIQVFRPRIGRKEDFEGRRYRFSRKSDIFSVLTELGRYISRAEVNRAYKRKVQKVRPVDLGESDSSKPGRDSNWLAKSKEEDVESRGEKYPK